MSERGGEALRGLAVALADTASLIGTVPEKLRVAPPHRHVQHGHVQHAQQDPGELQDLLDRLTGRLGLPGVDLVPDTGDLWAAELALSRRLALDPAALAGTGGSLAQVVRDALTGPPGEPVVVAAQDGTPLRAYAAGRPDRPVVIAVPAVGMPVGLVTPWLRGLSGSYRVLTWESRALFAARGDKDLPPLHGHDLATQGQDLLDVLDAFGVERAHAMGLCGGAAIALSAAALSGRVTSLSLWHGDLDLGGDAPKTQHQQDIQSLLTMAGRGRDRAAGLYRLMRRPNVLETLRADVAHHLIHPYASPELLYRYGLLNSAIMDADCRPLLAAVDRPTLVVTSPEDTTAHPYGSVRAAELLSRGSLRLLPHGDHLTAFDAAPELVRIAEEFIRDPHREGGP